MLMIFLDVDVNGPYVHERTINTHPQFVCPPVGEPETTHPSCRCLCYLPSSFNRLHLYLDYLPPPHAVDVLPRGVCEQPFAGPSSAGEWSDPLPTATVDKGKARATDERSVENNGK